jgi:hypothetical protein
MAGGDEYPPHARCWQPEVLQSEIVFLHVLRLSWKSFWAGSSGACRTARPGGRRWNYFCCNHCSRAPESE